MKIVDSAISFWVPIQIQGAFNSSLVTGLIISSQSVMGLLADLIFPHLLKTFKTRSLIIFGFISMLTTTLILTGSVLWPFFLIFELTMIMWAIYYELFAFGSYQFMSLQVPLTHRSGAWGIADVFRNLGLFVGPLIAVWLLPTNYILLEVILIVIILVGFLLFKSSNKEVVIVDKVDTTNIKPAVEFKHWAILVKAIWPAISMTFLLTLIDSTFWITGSIWTESLIKESAWGGFLLPAYTLPSLFIGLILARWEIYKGKKILAEKMIILTGFFLFLMAFGGSIHWILLMVLISSSFSGLAYPLLDGVYSDLIERMGREKKDMIGLTNSTVNLAYIICPPIMGIIVSQIGPRMSFSYVGLLVILAAIGLLVLTPKKLRLPQEEMQSWSLKDH